MADAVCATHAETCTSPRLEVAAAAGHVAVGMPSLVTVRPFVVADEARSSSISKVGPSGREVRLACPSARAAGAAQSLASATMGAYVSIRAARLAPVPVSALSLVNRPTSPASLTETGRPTIITPGRLAIVSPRPRPEPAPASRRRAEPRLLGPVGTLRMAPQPQPTVRTARVALKRSSPTAGPVPSSVMAGRPKGGPRKPSP